jgi:DNA-binding CsgD family transcriptional regulator
VLLHAEVDEEEASSLMLEWARLVEEACLIVDPERRVLWRNPAAEHLADRSETLALRGGQLTTLDRTLTQELDRFLDGARHNGSDASVCMPCIDGDGYILIRAHHLRWRERDAFGLRLQLTGKGYRPRYADYRAVFGLTPAEAAIVSEIMDGFTATDIAGRSGLSVGTVRTHVRNIYAKMDVTSREQLFFKLRPFRIF